MFFLFLFICSYLRLSLLSRYLILAPDAFGLFLGSRIQYGRKSPPKVSFPRITWLHHNAFSCLLIIKVTLEPILFLFCLFPTL